MKTSSAKSNRPYLLGERPKLKSEDETLRDLIRCAGVFTLVVLVASGLVFFILEACGS